MLTWELELEGCQLKLWHDQSHKERSHKVEGTSVPMDSMEPNQLSHLEVTTPWLLRERETPNLVKPLFWVPCHLPSNQVLINIVVELELKPVWLQRPKLTRLTCCFYCTTLYPHWSILLWSVFHYLHLENHSINIYQVPGSELENKPRI